MSDACRLRFLGAIGILTLAPGGRYNEILFMIDTCQANTLYSKFYSPNILATGSSEKDENSYSVSRGGRGNKSDLYYLELTMAIH